MENGGDGGADVTSLAVIDWDEPRTGEVEPRLSDDELKALFDVICNWAIERVQWSHEAETIHRHTHVEFLYECTVSLQVAKFAVITDQQLDDVYSLFFPGHNQEDFEPTYLEKWMRIEASYWLFIAANAALSARLTPYQDYHPYFQIESRNRKPEIGLLEQQIFDQADHNFGVGLELAWRYAALRKCFPEPHANQSLVSSHLKKTFESNKRVGKPSKKRKWLPIAAVIREKHPTWSKTKTANFILKEYPDAHHGSIMRAISSLFVK